MSAMTVYRGNTRIIFMIGGGRSPAMTVYGKGFNGEAYFSLRP